MCVYPISSNKLGPFKDRFSLKVVPVYYLHFKFTENILSGYEQYHTRSFLDTWKVELARGLVNPFSWADDFICKENVEGKSHIFFHCIETKSVGRYIPAWNWTHFGRIETVRDSSLNVSDSCSLYFWGRFQLVWELEEWLVFHWIRASFNSSLKRWRRQFKFKLRLSFSNGWL